MQKQFNAYENPEDLAGITSLDVRDFREELQFHKVIAEIYPNGEYQILFWKVMPYKIPKVWN
ncbi:MAG: hypothetical protein II992_12485 [Lachnospiraceae bacterium]|nr:hypothetical protein [Lachnospiraceae bacterium]